jgi:hypothetical protein
VVISLENLEFLKASFQENITRYITWAGIQNKNHYFITIDTSTYSSPIRQLKAKPRVTIQRDSNQFDD